MKKDLISNRIPRQFQCIIGEMLIDTNCNRAGDILHVYRQENGGYLAKNTRTGQLAYVFAAMLRNAQIFKIIKVQKVSDTII